MSPEEKQTEQAGEERDELFRKLRERIVSILTRRFGRERAEDIAQDVMVILARRYPHVNSEEIDKVAWTIMGYLKLEQVRNHWRLTQEPEGGFVLADAKPAIDIELIRRERYKWLAARILQLKQGCRKLIRLRLEEKTSEEIGSEMGMSVGAVNTSLSRCLKRLKMIAVQQQDDAGRS
jgi:RNA polymerase sigma factor (sigma-70 family)